jgi:hypothetical protein
LDRSLKTLAVSGVVGCVFTANGYALDFMNDTYQIKHYSIVLLLVLFRNRVERPRPALRRQTETPNGQTSLPTAGP